MRNRASVESLLFLLIICGTTQPLWAEVILGDPPQAPADVSGLPGGGPHARIVTGGFTVDASSREQVREFYNAVYTSSEGIPIDSSAVTASCYPGTNSPTFMNVTLRRINWFRAQAGLPAAVTLDATESTKDQAAAVMMSEHGALQHVGNWTGWNCFSSAGTNASANSNLALGSDGPDAITGYIWDYGANNYEVGHRRWILYPQTQVMGSGDVPPENSYYSANATWVFDANFGGPRPATRMPYVAWPPAGYVPYQVVYPQWSFALSNANLSASTVTMSSNGVPVAITQQAYTVGYGENTLVWYPTGLDPTVATPFPFGGSDTVYVVTVNNVQTSTGTQSFAYAVTAFDPATTGVDYSPLVITGPNQPAVNKPNPYTCTPATNPNTTGYQWLTAQITTGDLVDNAMNSLANFTILPAPVYSIITNPPVGLGNCFHLAQPNPVPQLLQLNELLFPTTASTLSFDSLLGYAMPDQVARVQVSTDGGANWQDLYAQAGTGGAGESTFTHHSFSLAASAGQRAVLRFNYDFSSGSYFNQTDSDVGWCIENIVVANSLQLVNQTTNSTTSTNFVFTPSQPGNYLLQARGVIFTEFPIDWGQAKQVVAVTASSPVVTLNNLTLSANQVKINFTLISGSASIFHLLQANQPGVAWTTNATAVLTTNTPGASFQFTTTKGSAVQFYRVQTP